MAPTADTVAPLRRQAHRAAPHKHKIVPAVPLKFSRPSRPTKPITPVETSPTPVTQHDAEPQDLPNHVEELSLETPSKGLLTPESKASVPHGESERKVLEQQPSTPDSVGNISSGTQADTKTESKESAENGFISGPSTTINGQNTPIARSELPPPFYPSEKSLSQAAPYSGIESSHASKPSVDGIIFGATQDATLPLTPHEMEQDNRVADQSSGLIQQDFSHPFYPGHSHLSSVQVPWIPPPVSSAPHDGSYLNGGSFHGPQFPLHGVYNGTYQDTTSPRVVPPNIDGVGRSHSQSPAKHQFSGIQPTSELSEDHGFAAIRNGNGLPPFVTHDKFDVPLELAEYMFSRLGSREFADCVLCIRSSDAILFQLPVHAVIVARSQPIASAIQRSRASNFKPVNALPQVDIFAHDPYVTADSITEGIRALYGSPLFPVEQMLYGLRPFRVEEAQGQASQDARKRMAQAIGYTAVGRFFQLRSLQKHGNLMIRTLLRWDTIEQVMEYALNESVYSRNNPAREATTQEEFDATNLLERDCVDFIAFNMPSTFKLDPIAPELQQFPRLPHVIENRPATHNPRLSRIRFGDVPPEDDVKPDYITRVLSSILLSLPLALLDGIFNHQILNNQYGASGVERLMHDVIEERESRRQKALSSGVGSKPKEIPQRLIENMFNQEQLNGRTLSEQRRHER